MPTVIRSSRRLDQFLYEAAQNFEVFSNIHEGNLKIKNFFKAYPLVPLSCRSNLAGRYLYSKCSPMQVWFPALLLKMNLNLNTFQIKIVQENTVFQMTQFFNIWHSKVDYCTLLKKMLNFECKSADLVCKINDLCLQFYLLFIVCFHPFPPTPFY
jgi:hypothetical protein